MTVMMEDAKRYTWHICTPTHIV